MSALTDLKVGGNNLEHLPKKFGWLPELKTLWLQNNRFRSIPDQVIEIHSLETLDIRKNPLDAKIGINKERMDRLYENGCNVIF
jgi:Leucine-rich repeat (LRR) protein